MSEEEMERIVKVVNVCFYIIFALLGFQLFTHVMVSILLIMGVLL